MPAASPPLAPETMSSEAIYVAIPARYASTRLPGKPLVDLGGRSMVEHVYRRAQAAQQVDRVVVLTDDERIEAAVRAFGGEVEQTPADCPSGTDRIASAARNWPAGAVINVQGDEPLIDPAVIDATAAHLREHPEDPMVTLASPLDPEDFENPNTVKVVVDRRGYALYFSRAAIPFSRNAGHASPRQHIGLYGYRRDTLLDLSRRQPTPLERTEALEQLRALENGIPIRVLDVPRAAPGVDTPEDVERVRRLLAQNPQL